ncbi:bifunctional tetrahydrofolate synthase/dihydrofolate synthase [Alkalilimnicola sp. S0819]|uniref:bifunctional tetrahydrofolate synthase/dihydrofolate synthase n=1 Tax=Alkalilimnicola sp. S0819 TaxID=2613922 RepID=UPI001261DCCD|nr:bifunctional tetrahydrofolate synthase/dihydrofolate synthase [Alkalilimnicola sp. S0819]KAB7627865.1 bifunctional tetrahydrofolate synthase/dihydrofolate synthase [Alkalilimnicola sp. S0819]MPQ15499.1 bifunctional tetrahydrofolate synthase/dihydrofolate synthase [Alkalilimnicola sp. S0819]
MRHTTLEAWLNWQQGLHVAAIELGLERVREVARRLDLLRPACPVITVAGTNGKGSTVALLEAIYGAAGHRVGSYTSPHLLRYNERIRLNGREASDEELMAAFDAIDRARGDISLTYFEFGTLAALWCFARAEPDLILLEVGLGGRLDAVNIVDADVAVISSIGLDHTDWLGADRESIGREKAGIARAGRPLICADPEPPASLAATARQAGARLYRIGEDFQVEIAAMSRADNAAAPCRSGTRPRSLSSHSPSRWHWRFGTHQHDNLPPPALPGPWQIHNAAAALCAVQLLAERLPVNRAALEQGLRGALLRGRFQRLPGPVEWILDVAHNQDGAGNLAQLLAAQAPADGGRTLAVCAAMARKDAQGLIAPLRGRIDAWYLLALPDPEARKPQELATIIEGLAAGPVAARGAAPDLLAQAQADARPGDRIVVFGSFRSVEEALRWHGDRQRGVA